MKWQDTLNTAGSIASITGVSLVWFKALTPNVTYFNLVFGLFASIVGALVTVGLIALTIEILQSGARRFEVNTSNQKKLTIYWSFSTAAAMLVGGMLLFLTWGLVSIAWIIK